jgi:hypothetical protein
MLILLLSLQAAPKFEHQVLDPAIQIGYGLAVGDVDGDGKPDVLLADQRQFVWYRNGDWKKFVMVENLTARDNVCLAARDIDGDGKVEVAVGAQWNPGETNDPAKSGSVHYLVRPADPTQKWEPVELHHEVTVHRMRWVRVAPERFQLVVVPLHGKGNKDGKGAGVRVLGYEKPADPKAEWKTYLVDESLHITHNFDVYESPDSRRAGGEGIIIIGREGIVDALYAEGQWNRKFSAVDGMAEGGGEIRTSRLGTDQRLVSTIEPWHGHQLVCYLGRNVRRVLDAGLNQGHALGVADFLGLGRDQIAVGWRNPDKDKRVGIKLYVPDDASGEKWTGHLLDDNTMATEDLQVADLDGDKKPDLVAAGRATKNVKIYWNRN